MKIIVILGFLWVYSLSAFGTTIKPFMADEKSFEYVVKISSENSAPSPLESDGGADTEEDASSEEVGDEEWAPAFDLHAWSSSIFQIFCHYKPLHLRHFSERLFRPPEF